MTIKALNHSFIACSKNELFDGKARLQIHLTDDTCDYEVVNIDV